MKTFTIPSKLGAERLRPDDPNRDEKRGGTGMGRLYKRENIPLPENDAEVPAAVEAFNKLAGKKGWNARLESLVKVYIKAVSLVNQAEMNQQAFAAHGLDDGSTPAKAPKDLSGADEI